MKVLREFLKRYRTPLGVFFGLFLLDQVAQYPLSELTVATSLWMVLQAMCWALAAASFGLILGGYVRYIYVPLALLLLIVGVSECYCMTAFRTVVKGDWLLLVGDTSADEVLSVLRTNWLPITLVALPGLTLSAWLLWLVARWKSAPAPRRLGRILVGAMLWVPVLLTEGVFGDWSNFGHEVISFQVVADTAAQMTVYSDLASICRKPQFTSAVPSAPKKGTLPLMVLAVGESATRNNWHLYGYERDTTPMMDRIADELVVFRDLVGVWSQTPMAVRYLFTMATLDEPSQARFTMPQALVRLGYQSYLISRQAKWGPWDSMITRVFGACIEKTYISSKSAPNDTERKWFDRDVLPILEDTLQQKPSPKAVILHLYGSHYEYGPRCPDDEKYFGEEGERTTLDDYDNTIRHEDSVLNGIIERVRATKQEAVVVYVSDHGETPRAHSWRVHDDYDLWELPMIVWVSREYREAHPDVMRMLEKAAKLPLQSDQVMPVILTLAGGAELVPAEKNPMCAEFKVRKPRLIMNGSTPYKHDVPEEDAGKCE